MAKHEQKHFPECQEFQLAPALWLCKACGVRVMKRIWGMDTGWSDLPELQNALFGDKHVCKSKKKE